VGRAASVLTRGRWLALAGWLAAGAAWYFAADQIPRLPLWWEVALLACVLMPAVFLFDWIVLPLCRARRLLPLAGCLAALAILAEVGDLEVLANAAKLAAVTFFAFWFLGLFEELVLLVVIAAIVPFVDAYSVFRGPTGHIVEHHSDVFDACACYWGLLGQANVPRLGIPDVLFFALYLAAAVRFGLRPGWTWLAMVGALGATIAITVWADVAGLPALPALSVGFLVPNADLIWAQLRRQGLFFILGFKPQAGEGTAGCGSGFIDGAALADRAMTAPLAFRLVENRNLRQLAAHAATAAAVLTHVPTPGVQPGRAIASAKCANIRLNDMLIRTFLLRLTSTACCSHAGNKIRLPVVTRTIATSVLYALGCAVAGRITPACGLGS